MARKRNPLIVKDVESGVQDAYIRIPVGLTVDLVIMKLTNCTPAQMKNIRIMAGTDSFQRFRDGDELTNYNKHYKRYTNTAGGYLHLYFIRPEMDNYSERRLTAWGTSDLNQAQIMFDIDGATVNPAVQAWSVRSPAQPAGMLTRILPFKETYATSGEHSIPDVHKDVRGRVAAIHLIDADLTSARLELDTVPVWDLPRTESIEFAKAMERDPQASWTTLEFIEEGKSENALIMQGVKESALTFNLSASGDVLGLYETFGAVIQAAA